MTDVSLGSKIPNFSLTGTSGLQFNLENFLGKNIVLYFYPKDSTPGCTNEGIDFKDHYEEFQKLNTEVFGLSRDSIKSHENFKTKYNFPFELLSDADEIACKIFDVIKMKNMYGKQVQGIERSTFLINKDGILIHEWRKVKVDGHVVEVLNQLKENS